MRNLVLKLSRNTVKPNISPNIFGEKAVKDPYRLPTDMFCFLNISGGRTSAYMLRKVLDRYQGVLPDNVKPVFTNTGKEHPATLDFLRDIEEKWNVPILWLEYEYLPEKRGTKNDPRHVHKVVTYETAAREGEPFAKLLKIKKRPPNVVQRFCTQELKVRTIERYAKREMKLPEFVNALGIRADESRRFKKGLLSGCNLLYPLAVAGITEKDVLDFWKQSDFDLKIDGRWSNCDLCFLKGKKLTRQLIAENPKSVDWWIKQEVDTGGFFRKKTRYAEIAKEPMQLDFFEDEKKIDCFCGD